MDLSESSNEVIAYTIITQENRKFSRLIRLLSNMMQRCYYVEYAAMLRILRFQRKPYSLLLSGLWISSLRNDAITDHREPYNFVDRNFPFHLLFTRRQHIWGNPRLVTENRPLIRSQWRPNENRKNYRRGEFNREVCV